MPERTILIQYVVNQRNERPTGWRVWSDGQVQRCADDNSPPGMTDLLERDRELNWQDEKQLGAEQVDVLRATIRESGFFDLPPRLLINYCKDDPGTAIWTVNLGGQTARVVVYDPRPRRSAEIDKLLAELNAVVV
jgi:hypothetical protein